MADSSQPFVASDHPLAAQPITAYMVYWRAEPDASGRTAFCSCPDYFKRNVLDCQPAYICKHLRNLAAHAGLVLHARDPLDCPPSPAVVLATRDHH